MARSEIDSAWSGWIRTNIERGCSKDDLARILIREGFDPQAVRRALHLKPHVERPIVQAHGPASAPTPATMANVRRFDSSRIELYTANDFLDPEECRSIVSLTQGRMRESTITSPAEPDRYFRRSLTCDLGLFREEAVQRLERKLCAALATDERYAEPTQAQHYDPGGEFKPHTDYFEEYEASRYFLPDLGQRSWSFMVYLNDTLEGGETAFVNVGLVIRPKAGLAVVWNNLLPDGRPNPDTLHHGTPVKRGHKDIITKWFRVQRRAEKCS